MSTDTIRWVAVAMAAAGLALAGCEAKEGESQSADALRPEGNGDGSVAALMAARNLSEADVSAALKTYTPTGGRDEYLMLASGGHSGQMIVIGVPSMRILKIVAVFTPEPWQGYGYGDETGAMLAAAKRDGQPLSWADTHHPGLSETAGDYDGKFMFLGDKANARVAVVDLKDFITTQIVVNPLIQSDHGAAFVTPNTEYVIEATQYPAPLGGGYVPIEQFDESYRGAVTFWSFDRAQGRIVPEKSFAIELPPYMQDLADAGKLASEGLVFINSFNTERSWGGNMEGKPPIESGASQNDMDYLHVIDWKKAEQVANAGKTETIAGMRVIRLSTATAEGLLHFVPEPKSPHGVDVTPDGEDVVVGGKLDTHCTVYSVGKLKQLIAEKKYTGTDPYGVPILPFEEAIRGQVEIGLGPLHTVFDDKGNAYTSVFIETVVAKWSVKDLKLIEKLPSHYNIGHITAAEGDTVSPDGHYVVALNKWSLDRFNDIGPLLPQNLQLIDVSGEKMQLLYDLPVPLGEPHYAQIIKADKLAPIEIYSPAGTNSLTHALDANAVAGGQERVERKPDGVHVYMTAVRSHFTPDILRVKQGDKIFLHITNVEQAEDATHGFAIGAHNINLSLEPGEHANVMLVAGRPGVYPIYCTEFCSALHLEMAGYMLVEPQ